jgi:virginiamycin B lyase
MRPIRPTLLLATLAATAALPAGSAHAAPAVAGEFALPGANIPGQLTAGPDGNIWVALSGGDKDVAKVAPDGTVTAYEVSAIPGSPTGIVAGPDGNLWTTVNGGVVRFSPATPDTGDTLFPVAAITDPRRIVAAPDGNLWTASGDQLVKITTAGVATPTTVTGMGARGITVAGDGKLYVADFGGTRIVATSTATPATQTFVAVGGGPQEVAVAPTGQVAFGNPGAFPQTIGRFTPGGPVATVDVPNADPFGVTVGADGAFWFAQFAAGTLGRLAADGTFTALGGLTAAAGPRWVTTAPGDTLWVSEEVSRKIAKVTGVSAPAPVVPTPDPVVPGPGPGPAPGPGTVADVTAPVLSAFSGPARIRRGTAATFRITVSEAAAVTYRFQRLAPGRRRGSRCVSPTAAARRAKPCTRVLAVGSIVTSAVAGQVTFRFSGRLKGRTLAPGRYRVTPIAQEPAGNRATGRPRALVVLR